MAADKPIVVGAVIYDPKVTVIWGIIRDFFEGLRRPIDVVLYSNYELQVDGLVKRHLEVAWNSPLAWLDTQRRAGGCRAIAMRDTDRDRRTHLVVRKSAGFTTVKDLEGKTVALGAKDSPQANLIPAEMLRAAGVKTTQRRFDVLVGLHGDHVGGELDALRCLQIGQAQACVMLDLNWDRWSKDGTIDPNEYQVLASTEQFDHCNFTVLADFPPEREQSFLKALFSMSYDDPKHREMMDMEGLKAWVSGRDTGYAWVSRAVASQEYWKHNP